MGNSRKAVSLKEALDMIEQGVSYQSKTPRKRRKAMEMV
jgi:hypothetical protein